MHTAKHMEDRTTIGFSEFETSEEKDEYDDQVTSGSRDKKKFKPSFRMIHLTKLLFGSRKKSGWHRVDLKQELQDAIGHAHGFQTDIGSRYGYQYANAKELLLNWDHVSTVIDSAPATNKPAKV